jgi:hypothetical protein
VHFTFLPPTLLRGLVFIQLSIKGHSEDETFAIPHVWRAKEAVWGKWRIATDINETRIIYARWVGETISEI